MLARSVRTGESPLTFTVNDASHHFLPIGRTYKSLVLTFTVNDASHHFLPIGRTYKSLVLTFTVNDASHHFLPIGHTSLPKLTGHPNTYPKRVLHRMFVYGIRCSPADLVSIYERFPYGQAHADYYMEYGLLVFPEYTRTTVIQSHCGLTDEFWQRVRRIVEKSNRPHYVELEHPWITDGQANMVRIIKEAYPTTDVDWYYVPAVASTQE